ncbi:MAG: FTR1 family protein, partial [Deltaproteobacteria bacterium]|nr:FTR1 family protein [Deltaproteobacteria bacterium]
KVASSSDETLLQEPGISLDTLTALRTHSGKENVSDALLIAKENLNQAFKDYKSGQIEAARKKALLAYLEGVEPIEPRLKANDPQFVIDIEMKMAAARQAIESKKTPEEVFLKIQTAQEALTQAASLLEKKEASAWFTFLMTLGIILREGFEAILIIIALLGVVQATGSTKAAHWIHGGWILAIVSGGVFWLFSGWGSNLLGLASLSFIAVFREAFETVLFLRAVWLESGMASKTTLALGTLTSFALLVVMAMALLKFSARLPIRKLFSLSSSVILVLAVILTGQGLHAFQEAGTLSITTSPLNLRWDLIGFYPTLETLLSQFGMILLCVGLWVYGNRASQ